MRYLILLSIVPALLFSCSQRPSKTEVDVLIRSAAIIQVETGRIDYNKTIAVKGDSIVAVVDDSVGVSFEAHHVVDATGKFVIPGLWDMHVHFGGGDTLIQENKDLLPLYVANGITAVRDCAADISPSVLQWRKEIAAGTLQGPTLFTSGPKLEGINSMWIGDLEIDNTEDMNKALDSLQHMQVDFVKITDNTLRPALFLEILKAAKTRGLKTSGHIPFALTMQQVSAAGLGSVEHMTYILKAGSRDEQKISDAVAAGKLTYREALPLLLDSFDEQVANKAYNDMAANGTAVVPTLNISYQTAYLDQTDHQHDDYLKYIGKGLKKTYDWRVERAAKDDAKAIDTRHKIYEKTKTLLPLLQRAGVTIMAGTDAGYLNSFDYPGLALHEELKLFTEAGLTPLEALQTAILHGPAFLQKPRYGEVVPGKFADMLILNQNPLLDIQATRSIDAVMLKGKLLDRKALDALFEDAAKKVREQTPL
ncbi:amidohydrolase family protein [Chryseolinea lacunae]|uniref:Amidohydrolase family protein n=1 Tax=Chryseolinea lacunae TaxID=2801331 RepID=A0ABS1KU38_9BACT|nr:amidohydrolase family protein [Chryseolinea lacunae]MBL0742946.1 amidohydrolase family protein [Chryseolinea lacunae]